MSMRRRNFEIDRENGKMLGVCAGLANTTGIDATVIRIGAVLLAIFTSVMPVLAIYLVAGLVGGRRRTAAYAENFAPRRSATREESRERMRSIDLRMQAIETYVTSSNSQLAREIEDLRN